MGLFEGEILKNIRAAEGLPPGKPPVLRRAALEDASRALPAPYERDAEEKDAQPPVFAVQPKKARFEEPYTAFAAVPRQQGETREAAGAEQQAASPCEAARETVRLIERQLRRSDRPII